MDAGSYKHDLPAIAWIVQVEATAWRYVSVTIYLLAGLFRT